MAEALSGSTSGGGAASGPRNPAPSAMRSFKILFYLAAAGIVLFGGAWILIGAADPLLVNSPVLRGILGAVGGAAILMVVFICPVAVLAAVIGTLIAVVKHRER